MIQIAILDANLDRWRAIVPRLRGATVQVARELAPEALTMVDAVAFFQAPPDAAIEQALQAGKRILLAGGARKWADRNGLVIVNPDRYLPSRQLIRQQLDAGKLGEPGLIRIHRWESAATDDALPCDLDLVLWYFRKTPNVVYAVENAGCTQIHLGFPGGGMALLDHAKRLSAGDRYYSLSVIGASGAAHADDHSNTQLAFQGGSPHAIHADEGVMQYAALVQAFVDGTVGHDSNRAEGWSNVFAVHDAVRQSLRTKQAIAMEGAVSK